MLTNGRSVVLCLLAAIIPGCGTLDGQGSQEELLDVNGTQLFVKRIGAGEPILVVHGGPVMEHGYLLPHLAPLARTHELIFYDQRLCGRSAGQVSTESVRISTFVDDIEALRRALKLDRVHLMAHSFGGLLAMHYALRYPDQLRSLILLDSMSADSSLWREEEMLLAERVSDDDTAAREAVLASEAFARREPNAIADLLRISFRAQFHDPGRVDELQLYVPEDYMARSQQFGAMVADLESFDLHERLEGMSVPALILYGAKEPGAELGGQALKARLPNADWVVIEDAGHFPFVESPEDFLREVRRFLRKAK